LDAFVDHLLIFHFEEGQLKKRDVFNDHDHDLYLHKYLRVK